MNLFFGGAGLPLPGRPAPTFGAPAEGVREFFQFPYILWVGEKGGTARPEEWGGGRLSGACEGLGPETVVGGGVVPRVWLGGARKDLEEKCGLCPAPFRKAAEPFGPLGARPTVWGAGNAPQGFFFGPNKLGSSGKLSGGPPVFGRLGSRGLGPGGETRGNFGLSARRGVFFWGGGGGVGFAHGTTAPWAFPAFFVHWGPTRLFLVWGFLKAQRPGQSPRPRGCWVRRRKLPPQRPSVFRPGPVFVSEQRAVGSFFFSKLGPEYLRAKRAPGGMA